MKQNIIANIYRIQAYESIMCGYACIGFIGSMLKGKNLLDHFLLTKRSKISYICDKTLFLSSICNNCGSEDKKIF